MHFLHLTWLYCALGFWSTAPNPPSPSKVVLGASNVILQSKDGGQTWHDISKGLPEAVKPEIFFEGESEIFLRVRDGLYKRKKNLETRVWERANDLDPQCSSIAFKRSGVIASTTPGSWLQIYTTSKPQSPQATFETSHGILFAAREDGLYKSTDKGRSWKPVVKDCWVMDLVESEGVLVGTGQHGIMRSTDDGENWEWVIREGGVGIAIERIDGGFAAISTSASTLSRRIRISLDGGETWKAIDEALRPSLSVSCIKQVGKHLICGHPDGIFLSFDMGRTWTNVRSNFDNANKIYDKVVFTIYVSDDVLYAVAKGVGC